MGKRKVIKQQVAVLSLLLGLSFKHALEVAEHKIILKCSIPHKTPIKSKTTDFTIRIGPSKKQAE